MTTTVTIDMFSGRENPRFQLTEQQEGELAERLASSSKPTRFRPTGAFGGLGYRGLMLQRPSGHPGGPLSLRLHEGIIDQGLQSFNMVDDSQLETWLLGIGNKHIPQPARKQIKPNSKSNYSLELDEQAACPANVAADAPAYAPATWNTGSVQPYNNCYNYANDQITNTFAQPGRASGHAIGALACVDVSNAAASDGLISTNNFNTPLTTGQGWYVALVIWPGMDYHWYRQDIGGCWSHKPGQTSARNVDNAGKTIQDPQTCDRGPYVNFCTYMITKNGVKIR